MVVPHRHDERVVKQESARKALAALVEGPDREIKLAVIQQGRISSRRPGRAQVEPYPRRRCSYGRQNNSEARITAA